MKLPLPTFTITTPHDAFVCQTGVEEIIGTLNEALQGNNYEATIFELKRHMTTVQWWIENLEDDRPVTKCHKNDPAFHENRGS
ncbi:hypothetical protein LZG74_25385 [Dyadobacter sp. CY327]|uniref:hypothetical protein n=1 Tax=Dyadobacter sp. CY327 TaxID=2907301 RepID=UPI001F401EF7|nr:hypothetical protein [Dyadobacter sp. CY327]MCE7073668.1 hypothetical protein [Dyadobacter sp. CY327]